ACVSAFRDELTALFPGNQQAQRLSQQTKFITEFTEATCSGKPLAQVSAHALVQIHCHHHAVIKTEAEILALNRIGIDYEVLQSGCCGMAGSFGFERDKYDVSVAAAERVLLPAIRAAPAASIILANGFSCREQIEQTGDNARCRVARSLARCQVRNGPAPGTW